MGTPKEAIDRLGESTVVIEEMARGLDRLLGESDRRELMLNPEEAKKIGWHGWEEPLRIKIEKKRSFRGLSIDNCASGEVLVLDGNSAELLSFQIYEGKNTTPAPLSHEEEDPNFISEWQDYIDKIRMVVGEASGHALV